MRNPKLLVATFFVAALLAVAAAAFRWFRDGEIRLTLVAAALFMGAMGLRYARQARASAS